MPDLKEPQIIDQPLPNHTGRGRPSGLKPVLLVMHIQDGYGNPWGYFHGLPDSGPNAADCTIWNPRAADALLHRYLSDLDTAWTNGGWSEPINHANPVIQKLFQDDVYTGDVSLTIEHEGKPGDGITDAQLERSAQIIAFWSKKFNIPVDRSHVIGHYEIGPHKYCPGQLFPFDRLIARAAEIVAGGQPVPTPPAFPPGYFPETKQYVVNEIDVEGQHYIIGFLDYWQQHGGLEIFGYPLDGAQVGKAEDGCWMVFQDFEGRRFEYHISGKPGDTFHLGRSGEEAKEAGYPEKYPPAPTS